MAVELSALPEHRMGTAGGTSEAPLKPRMCSSLKERYGKSVGYVTLNVHCDQRPPAPFVVSGLKYSLKISQCMFSVDRIFQFSDTCRLLLV